MKKTKKDFAYVVGIDEAGRGPLAGPVSIAAAALPMKSKIPCFWGEVRDSKKLSPAAREKLYRLARLEREKGVLDFSSTLVGEAQIDKLGIVRAIRIGIQRCLKHLGCPPEHSLVLLDGGLRASRAYPHQKTLIRGDGREKLIALASIVAKVTRDRKMIRLSKDYPEYSFHIHKGYGTALHVRALKRHGISSAHRKTFVKKFT